MSDIEPGELDYHIARTTWLEADQAARLAYVNRTRSLQEQYNRDCLPYHDAYVHGERTAWSEYNNTVRANFREYQNKLTNVHAEAAAEVLHVHRQLATEPLTCGERPYPAGSEGDDGTQCVLPLGHAGNHSDILLNPRTEGNPQ